MEILTLKNELETKKQQLLKKYNHLTDFEKDIKNLLEECQKNPFLLCDYNDEIIQTLISEIYDKDTGTKKTKQLSMAKFIKDNMAQFEGYQFSQIELVRRQQLNILNDINDYFKKITGNEESLIKQSETKKNLEKIDNFLLNFDNQDLKNPILDIKNLLDILDLCEFDLDTKNDILLEIALKNASIYFNEQRSIKEEQNQDMFFDKEVTNSKPQLSLEDQILLSKIQKVLFKNQMRINNLDSKVKEYINSLSSVYKQNSDFLNQTKATNYFKDTVFLALMYNKVNELEYLLNEPPTDFENQKKEIINFLKVLYNHFFENQNMILTKTSDIKDREIFYLSTTSLRNYLVQDMKKNLQPKYFDNLLKALEEIKKGNILEDAKLDVFNQKLKNVCEKTCDKVSVAYLILDDNKVLILSCYIANKRELKTLLNRMENYSNKKKIEDLSNIDNKELERQNLLKQQFDEYMKEKGVINGTVVS